MPNGIAQLNRSQMAMLLKDLVESPEALGEDMPSHDDLVLALAQVVADHCGGKPELVIVGNDIEVRVQADDALPSVTENVWTAAAKAPRASTGELSP
jgi:hypothetical protein